MTEVIEGSPPPRIIRDWRDWLNELPSIKSFAFFCLAAWVATSLIVAGLGTFGYLRDIDPKPGVLRVLEIWLDTLLWLTAAAVFGVVGKRATEKPDVIRAEGEVKAAVVAAQATGSHAVPVTVDEVAEPLTRDSERGE
jgi:hypothetical protein